MADAPTTSSAGGQIGGSRDGEWLFSHIPEGILHSLSAEQRDAIHAAADSGAWGGHPVNIRLSLPVIGWRFFLTVVGGHEKRNAGRRGHDRSRHPLRTAANVLFFVGIAAIFYILAIFAIALQSTLIEF